MRAICHLVGALILTPVTCASPQQTMAIPNVLVVDPNSFCRVLFSDLGLRPLSECEERVRSRERSRGRYDALEDEPRETGDQMYLREHRAFRAMVYGLTEEAPIVLDGNLNRQGETTEKLPTGSPLIYVVPASPTEAMVDVFFKSDGWMPYEACFDARFVDGWWWFERQYASFDEWQFQDVLRRR